MSFLPSSDSLESTEASASRPAVPLYPPLGDPDELDAFVKAGRAVSFALSPRGNGLVAYETSKDLQARKTQRSRTAYFGQWERIRKEDAELFVESYVTFDSLQRISLAESEAQNGILSQNSEAISGCWKALGYYVDNLYAHLDRLGLSSNFNEARYNHWAAIASSTHLLQVLFTSESGNTASSVVGEEFLYWLNTHYVAPSSEEGPELDSHEKPWLEEGFWIFLVRCVLRGITKSAIYFLNKLITSHPSRPLRRLITELIPILQKHPRSKDYDSEPEFFSSHRRWKETLVRNYRRVVDDLEDEDGSGVKVGEGEWRSGVETLCAILEGDKEVVFRLCREQEWGWREALGVWGVWCDVRFTREALPSTLPAILETLPIDETHADELVQSALVMYDTSAAMEAARKWDLWFATHAIDVLDKLGELDDEEVRSVTGLSLRSNVLMEYAEHLYTDPSLWRVTLEYLGACGDEGRAMVAEVIMRVPVDIVLPSSEPPSTPIGGDVKGKGKEVNGFSDLDAILGNGVKDEEMDEEEKDRKAWDEWGDKVMKIIDVCKDYGLEDVLYSVCRSISQALIRRGFYGQAVKYSVLAKDGRGVGQIADLLLQVYITKGADEFRAQVATIPASLLPSGDENYGDLFLSRLLFLSRYAEFHEMFARGEKRTAARFLVVMLNAGIVPKWWWGVILLDAGGMLDDPEMVLSQDDAYELLRHLEEVYTRADQGSGADYLGALDRIMQGPSAGAEPSDRAPVVDVERALGQLKIVRLALARYLARCAVAGV